MRSIITKTQYTLATMIIVSVFVSPFFLLVSATKAAPNYQINYQGKLTNASNVAVADGTYNMRFWLLTSPSIATTSAVWTESLTGTDKVQVTNGLFSVMLGSTSPLTSVDFNQTLYLGVEIGGTGSPTWDGEMSPRKVLGAVPAAFEAENANTLDDLDSTQFVRTDATSTIDVTSASTLLSLIQSGSGDILNLFDDGTEVFTVTDGGRVGIGTTSPGRELAVDGDFGLSGGLYDNYGSGGTLGQILQSTTGGIQWIATSSLGFFDQTYFDTSAELAAILGDETGTAGAAVFSQNPLLQGFRSNASSTIGDGTQTGGLTIYGGATTTGNAYVGGNITGVGTLNISGLSTLGFASSTALTVSGNAYFNFASSSYASTTGITASKLYAETIYGNGVSIGSGRFYLGGSQTVTAVEHSFGTSYSGFMNVTGEGGDTVGGLHVGLSTNASGVAKDYYSVIGQRQKNTVWTSTPDQALSIGDYIPGIGFAGQSNTSAGTGMMLSASMLGVVDGTVSSGVMPLALVFHTSQTGKSGLIERMRITSTGTIGIGTTTPSRLLTVQGGDFWLGGNITATGTLNISGLATLGYASTTGLTTTNLFASNSSLGFASSTALTVAGNTYLSSLSDGCLNVTSGLVSSAACGSGEASDWLLTAAGDALTPSSTKGIAVFASSTIGDGTQTGGLTIYGGATTTGNTYLGGTLSLGSTSPSATLSVAGTGNTNLFAFASSTGSTLLSLNARGVLTFGTTTRSNVFINGGPTSTPFTDTSLLSNNIAIGNQAFSYASSTSLTESNIALGYQSLYGSSSVPMTGDNNFGAGYQSLYKNTSGFSNVAQGYRALWSNTTGAGNIATGYTNLWQNTTGDANIAQGHQTLRLNTTGSYNIAQGYQSMDKNLTGSYNIAQGYQALFNSTAGNDNVAIGRAALYNIQGDFNTGIGYGALNAALGTNNTAVGAGAGELVSQSGNANTFLGYGTDADGNTDLSTTTAIGANAKVGCSNCLVLGGLGADYANVGIGTTTPSRLLTVQGGDAWFGGNITATGTLNISGLATLGYASTTGLTTTNLFASNSSLGFASSTALTVAGNTYLSSLSDGCLNVTSGLVSSTGSACGSGSGSASNWLLTTAGDALTPSSTKGIAVFASSTIGDGTQTGGLTIYGGATTTGNTYLGGTLSLGSTTPSARLTIVGSGQSDIFRFASSTGHSLLTLDARGVLTFGTTTSADIFLNGGATSSVVQTNQNNIVIGNEAFSYYTPGSAIHNIAIGYRALYGSSTAPTTGDYNTAIGYQALMNSVASQNTALGYGALKTNRTGAFNTALGVSTLENNATGSANVAVGDGALYDHRAGDNNVAIGESSMSFNTHGFNNTAIGGSSLTNIGLGSNNTAVGYAALNNFTSSSSIAIGYQAGDALTNGRQNIIIGNNIDFGSASTSYALNIGNLIYGNNVDGEGTTLSTGNIGIGTSSPTRKLTVAGDGWFANNITAASSTITYASSTGLTASSLYATNATLTYASTTGLTAANAWFTGATTSALYATTLGVNSEYVTDLTGSGLTITNGALTATGDGVSNWTYNGSRLTPSSTVGIGIFASSTIGGGTQTTGLTIYGGATTTGNAYFASNIGIGSSSPYARLTIAGTADSQTPLFQTASSTGSTTFAVLANGDVEVAGNFVNAGVEWTARTAASSANWTSVAYGNGTFVALAGNGSVMVSQDGINWTLATSSTGITMYDVTYGNGQFVTVGVGAIVTSPDGINWTRRSSGSNTWKGVTYGNGLFVAVASNGGSKLSISRDGILWTDIVDPVGTISWIDAVYGNGRFVVIGDSGSSYLTSTDGINWSEVTGVAGLSDIAYGNGVFVSVGNLASVLYILTSSDGTTWTTRTPAAGNTWSGVTYGNGLFVAVSSDGTNRVMTSPDGINWTSRRAQQSTWNAATYGNGTFVAVGNSGAVMTSGKSLTNAFALNNIYQGGMSVLGGAFNIGTTTATATNPFASNILNIASTTGTSVFTILQNGNVGIGSTSPSRLLTVNGDIFTPYNISAASSTITYASSTGLTASNLYATNFTTTYGSSTGFTASNLYGTNALFTYASSSYASTTALTVQGNTYLASLADGCLNVTSGLVSSTGSACGSGSGSAPNWLLTAAGDALTPSSTKGIAVFASSTIGDGTGIGGLTIYGNSTTTLNAYIAGSLGIGTNNPATKLEVVGVASSSLLYVSPGTASLPSITFGGDTNTGLYSPGADSVALVSGGALGLRTTNNQAHLFTNQVFSSYAAQIGDYSNGATPVNGAAGSTGAGSSIINAIAIGGGGGSVAPSAFSAAMYSTSDGSIESWWYGLINQRMSGSGWDNTPAALTQGDYIPGIGFAGQSGTTQGTHMELSAAIQGIIDGAVSPNVMPIGLIFRTSQTDSSALQEHMRITSTGTVGIGTTSPSAKLSIHAKSGETNQLLFSIASSTASATSTLFSISNTGIASTTALVVSGNTTLSSLSDGCLSTVSGLITSSACGSGEASDWQLGGTGYLVPTSTVGIVVSASSTIGGGTGATGLTIYGGATTTGNTYMGGTLSLGSTTPAATLSVVGTGNTNLFNFASSTGASLLTLDARGVLKFGTSTTADIFVNGGPTGVNPQKHQNNIVIGNEAFTYASTTALPQNNIAIGYQALFGSSTIPQSGSENVAIGRQALANNASGTYNIAIGTLALAYNSTGIANTAVGYGAGLHNTTGYYNTAVGVSALQSNTGGYQNAALGYGALLNNTLGTNNAAMGWGSLAGNTDGVENSAFGSSALFQSTGSYNTAQGYRALYANNVGFANTSVGWQSMVANTSGYGNTGVGYGALSANSTGVYNAALGIVAGATNQTGNANTYFGLGADGTGSGFSTSTAIGANAKVGCSNCMVLGGTGADYANVGIGTTTPSALLTIGATSVSGSTVAGMKQYLGFTNSVVSATSYGNETYISSVPTATSTLIGSILRLSDTSQLGNTVRGIEVQVDRGTNTKGENTGIAAFGRTFGIRGTTVGDAGDTYLPAGVFAETEGTTQGNALRAYSGTITSEALVSFFHDTSHFTGTGLKMNFGNTSGSFAATTSAKFLDLQVGGTSKFTVAANGSTTIGDGTVNASLRIPRGGICVDNDGSCVSTTTGEIRSVTSVTGNSDLAEMYFSSQSLSAGEIVALQGGLSVKRAEEETKGQVIGVVSTKPGLLLGFDDTPLILGERAFPIGLQGRVPIKLSTENGPIKKGDPITLSSIPGVGMKATESSRIVGVALEDYDGTRAYTEGFLNQFGDDMVRDRVVARQTVDPRTQDGCYYGAGNALGEEVCTPTPVVIQPVEQVIDTLRDETLRDLANDEPLELETKNGTEVFVGQALMFIELGWYQTNTDALVLSELASTTLLENGKEGETIWTRVKALAQNFVDGVLTITGLKADRVDVKNELCVDDVCVTADDLRALLNNTQKTGGSSGGSPTPAPTPEPTPLPDTTTSGDGGGAEGGNESAGGEATITTDTNTNSGAGVEETPPPEPEQTQDPEPTPQPEPEPAPAPEPAPSEDPAA